MKRIPLVEVSALAPFVDFLSANGANLDRYAGAAGIPRDMLETLEGRVTKIQATRFLEYGREREGVPDLGFRVGQGFGPDQMGPLGTAMRRCATLGEALDILAVHLRNWWGGTLAWVDRDGDLAWLRVRADDTLKISRDVANQNGIFILTHIIRLAAGDDWTPSRIRIPRTPGNAHERFAATGEAEPDFDGEEIAVAFPAALLAAPLLPASGPAAPGEIPMVAHPEDIIEVLSEVLRNHILHGTVPGIEVAAEIVGASRRTLQRRLSEEGLTYRRLIDRVRYQIASDLLRKDFKAPVKEIARSAGFAGPGTFIRSFRRMTGMTPGEYRIRAGQFF